MSDSPKPRRTRKILLDGVVAAETGAAASVLVERFLEYVRHERALATNTQAAYRRDLRDFTGWLAGRLPATLNVRDLGDYFAALAKKGLARASIARQAATLKTFYAFLQLEGVITESPAELITAAKRDDVIPGTLSPAVRCAEHVVSEVSQCCTRPRAVHLRCASWSSRLHGSCYRHLGVELLL